MKRICAWCGKVMTGREQGTGVTHGICEDCFSNVLSRSRETLLDFLDNLEVPILVVNQEGVVDDKNEAARDVLGKGSDDIMGHRGGEVFDCIHSFKPGGCGGTIHCKACVIRNTVEETFRTGQFFLRVPATLKIIKNAQEKDISSYISTYKEGDYVYLKIEDLSMS